MNNPTFHLEGILKSSDEVTDFEGPLSLILMLLSKNKIEIRDISVAEILEQYLDYIREMEEMDIEVASEFVQMAAHLLYIKTKTLLDSEKELSELEQLMLSLEQLKCRELRESLKAVTPVMAEAAGRGFLLCTRQQEPLAPRARTYEYRHESADLLQALFAVFSRAGARVQAPPDAYNIAPKRIVYSVRDKCREIFTALVPGKSAPLRDLFADVKSRSELVAAFVAVLELCSHGSLLIGGDGDELTVTLADGDYSDVINKIEDEDVWSETN